MRDFNYSKIKEQKWDSEVLSLIAAIYKYAGKQELYLKQRPDCYPRRYLLPRYRKDQAMEITGYLQKPLKSQKA